MTTSGEITGTLTAGDIIEMAAELIGLAEAGETLSADIAKSGVRNLNWMLKSWQAKTTNLSRIESVNMAWPAATPEGLLSPNLLGVRNVYRRISGNDLPLWPLSLSDYSELPNKATVGVPLNYNTIKTNSTVTLRFWPVSPDIIDIRFDAIRIIEDVTAVTQTVDLPQEWLETVAYGLAKRLMAVYPASSVGVANGVAQLADDLYGSLMAYDQEDGSLFLQPAWSGGRGG